MEVNEILGNAKEQMEKSLDASKSRMEKIRTGRASAALVDGVRVDYYGTMSPLSQVAGVSVPDAGTIVIQPWDATTLPLIEKAIQQADLGFNPQNDGNIIRIHVPPLTEDRRIEFVKMTKKLAEDGKVGVRNVRRDMMDAVKKSEKDKDISEDEKKRGEDEIQKITNDYIKKIDDILNAKEKELMDD